MIDKTCGNCKHASCDRMSYMDDAACPAWTDRADSVEQVALNMLDALLSLGDTTAHRVYRDRLRALGVEA